MANLGPDRGLKAFCAGFANIDGLGLAVHRFHLDRQMVDAETVVQFFANRDKQVRMDDGFVMADVGRKRIDARRDRPDVQVVHAADTAQSP